MEPTRHHPRKKREEEKKKKQQREKTKEKKKEEACRLFWLSVFFSPSFFTKSRILHKTTMEQSVQTSHTDMIHDAQLDYYGKTLATCSSDRTIKIFDVSKGEPEHLHDITGHDGPVWQVLSLFIFLFSLLFFSFLFPSFPSLPFPSLPFPFPPFPFPSLSFPISPPLYRSDGLTPSLVLSSPLVPTTEPSVSGEKINPNLNGLVSTFVK